MPITFPELQAERLVRQIIASPNLPRARKHDMEEDARNGLSDARILLNLLNTLKRSERDTDDRDCLRWLETELGNRIAIGPKLETFPGSQEVFETGPTTLAQWLDGLEQQEETELTDTRCVEISNLSELFLEHWIELTGIGIGECRPYLICADSVTFIKWDDAFIADAPRDWQIDMLRDNRTASQLTFPCTPTELLQFIDTAVGAHRFSVPDAFRQAVISQPNMISKNAKPTPEAKKWAIRARKLAQEYITAWTSAGHSPTKKDAALYVEGAFSTEGTYGDRGEFLDSATIERWALKGITGHQPGHKSKKPKVPEGARGKMPETK